MNCFNLKKTNYSICNESKIANENFRLLLTEFYNSGSEGFFIGKKNIKIYYRSFLQPNLEKENGAILISSGRAEFTIKYQETIYDFFRNGFSVYIIDHRGQGFSERIYKLDTEIGHIDTFQYYVDDLKTFYELKIKHAKHKKNFLLGHSMGGAISLLYLEQYPNDFNKAALTSPMLGFDFFTCAAIKLLKLNKAVYARGKGNYTKSMETFENNTVTNSKIRFRILLELNEKFPQVKMGGPSYRWVYESCNAIKSIFTNAKNIAVPLLLLHGSNDKIVSASAHYKFVKLLKKLNKVFEEFPIDGAKHEILIEKDIYRSKAIAQLLIFFVSTQK